MPDIYDVDPVAIARAALLADEGMSAALGGDDRVGPYNEPPYPRLQLSDPPGNDRDTRHLIAPMVMIEALGDLDGTPGRPALRRILYRAITVLRDLPQVPVTDFEQTVVTGVGSTGGGGWAPLPNGQPRYITTLQIFAHPGRGA